MRWSGVEPSEPVCDMFPFAAMSALWSWAALVSLELTVTAEQPALARSALTSSTTRATSPVAVAEGLAVPGEEGAVEAGGFGAEVVGSALGVLAGSEARPVRAVFAFLFFASRALSDVSSSFFLCVFLCFFDGLASGVVRAEGSLPGRLLHSRYQFAPSHRSSEATVVAAVRSCRPRSSPGQSVQAMATDGMPMTLAAIAATAGRR